MFGCGESPVPDIIGISLGRVRQHIGHISVLFDKLGRLSPSEASHVLPDQYLCVTVRTGTDTNCRDDQFPGDLPSYFTRYHFQYQGKGTGTLQG